MEEETKIVQSRNIHTQYIVIPAAMVRDSQYPFRVDERVRITFDPYYKMMIMTSVEEHYMEVSREGITVRGKKIEIVES